ncbi:MAG: 7-cyano-7-deazaguanine synthase [Candidatus Omnitrophica bacterium]|nr:7-cyano-7-deazaguanine synthase [Candidatus Omnitrophota bacterium]
MNRRKDQDTAAVGVLTSGGVESAALVAAALKAYERVYPIYIRKGLKWEKAELDSLKEFLRTVESDGLAELTVLDVPVKPIYGNHWSVGEGTPASHEPDTAVFLPGRNLLLLSLAGLFCGLRRIPVLWLGILKGNPFHDARSGFLKQVEGLLEGSVGASLRIAAPFHELTKAQVIKRSPSLAWGKTFSCLEPIAGRHCGRCQKCAERKAGFKAAGVVDPTRYAR